MTTDKQELQRLCDTTNLHDSYCNGYHALPRAVKRHLSLEDMQEIWHCMVKPLLEELLAELAAVAAERDALKAQVPDGIVEKYNELLYHVARKFPNESRHETALRYIKNAESVESYCAAAQEEGDVSV